ncbi:DUF3127 domain-containing protein [Candidatus Cardinium hertigii]|uniref:DUF3127 domain-containing protein n=1 Tax=Candidatus Cardinium hertigii TaxID=247481 RepID=A0A2Z3L909_9BACT|nr:DUF3127 domain-containing protein [Candidatus Cardinium hertigii]AWN82038.1 hypothetical protein DK880_00728 [Candidatus Cardinium hertigii]
MNITGRLVEINAVQQLSDTFKKRTFVIEYTENPQYPEYISFELVQDRCELLDGFSEGEEVVVHFNLRGRKWSNPEGIVRYFNTLQAWRLEKGSRLDDVATTPTSFDVADDLPF